MKTSIALVLALVFASVISGEVIPLDDRPQNLVATKLASTPEMDDLVSSLVKGNLTPNPPYAPMYDGSETPVDIFMLDVGGCDRNTLLGLFPRPGIHWVNFKGAASYGTDVGGGHGTRQASLALTIAPGVRNFYCVMAGSQPEAINWVLAENSRNGGLGIVLIEFGYIDPDFDRALRRASESGLLVVGAAGNNSADACTTGPGTTEEVFVVGAYTTNAGKRPSAASFSGWGPCVDAWTIGGDAVTAYGVGGVLQPSAGTSVSAAITAGLMVLASSRCAYEEGRACSAGEVLATLVRLGRKSGLIPPAGGLALRGDPDTGFIPLSTPSWYRDLEVLRIGGSVYKFIGDAFRSAGPVRVVRTSTLVRVGRGLIRCGDGPVLGYPLYAHAAAELGHHAPQYYGLRSADFTAPSGSTVCVESTAVGGAWLFRLP